MDPQTTFTLKEVIMLLLAGGGCMATFWALVLKINNAISDTKAQITKEVSKSEADCKERLDRQSSRHEQQMEALRKTLTDIQLQGVTSEGFKSAIHELKDELEGNFTKTTKLLIAENNVTLTKELITQMSKIMDDKLHGIATPDRRVSST